MATELARYRLDLLEVWG